MNDTLSWLDAIDSYSSKTAKQKILANLKLSSAKFKIQCKNTLYFYMWNILNVNFLYKDTFGYHKRTGSKYALIM